MIPSAFCPNPNEYDEKWIPVSNMNTNDRLSKSDCMTALLIS